MFKCVIRLLLLFVAWLVAPATTPPSSIWTVIAVDPKGDGRDASSGDLAQLSYQYDNASDTVWFRVTLYGTPREDTSGITIRAHTETAQTGKSVTTCTTRESGEPPSTIVTGRVDGDSIVVAARRTDMADAFKMNVVASLGCGQVSNDDMPNGRSATLDLSAPRPSRGIREIDTRRNNFRYDAGYRTLGDDRPAPVITKGRGRERLILIPGVYSGDHAFDGFIQRNSSRYTFFIVTPPGLGGTSARPLPPETTSYGEFTWTRRLERDIAGVIARGHLERPIIVVHGFPGSLAAEEMASEHPDLIGGIVEVASMPVQFSPSARDPRRQTTPEERIVVVNEGWAAKWFKYVTPDTWESNNYPAEMFSNDRARAERTRLEVESTPLPVKIRYLCEFMASDHTAQLLNLSVPLLALRPGFNETVLADAANAWFKSSLQDSWIVFSKNPNIRLLTVPNARALILDDEPSVADEAIGSFVNTKNAHASGR